MIADKMSKSFYIVELQGSIIETIMAREELGIEKITIGSNSFDNDMEAGITMTEVMDALVVLSKADESTLVETVDFNPEFFPTIQNEYVEKKKVAYDQAKLDMEDNLEEGKIAVPLTKVFDPLGDYVMLRRQLQTPDFVITGKIGFNSDEYMKLKVEEATAEASVFHRQQPPQIH